MSWRHFLAATTAALVFSTSLGAGALGTEKTLPTPQLKTQQTTAQPVNVEITDLAPRVLEKQDKLVVKGTLTLDHDAPTVNLHVRMRAQSALNARQLAEFLDGQAYAGQWVATSQINNVKAGTPHAFTIEIPRANLPLGDNWEWGPRGLEVVAETPSAFAGDRTLILWDSGVNIEPTHLHAVAPLIGNLEVKPAETKTADNLASGSVDVKELITSVNAQYAPPSEKTWQHVAEIAKIRGVSLAVPADALTSEYAQTQLQHAASEIIAVPAGHPDVVAISKLEAAPQLVNSLKTQVTSFNYANLPVRTDVVVPLTPAAKAKQNYTEQLLEDAPQLVDAPTLKQWAGHTVIAGELPLTHPFDYTFQPGTWSFYTADGNLTDSAANGGTLLTTSHALNQVFAREATSDAQRLDDEQMLRALSAVITRERPFDKRDFLTLLPVRALDEVQAGRLHALLDNRWVETSQQFYAPTKVEAVAERSFPAAVAPPVSTLTSSELQSLDAATQAAFPMAQALGVQNQVKAHQLEYVQLLSSAYVADNAPQRQALAAGYSQQMSLLGQAIRVIKPATINLLDTDAKLPLRVVNDADTEASVIVNLRPSDPRLQVPQQLPITLPPHGEQKLEFPVTAVGSGDVDVRVVVQAADYSVINQSTQFEVRVRADWASTGTLGIVIILVGLVVFGGVRTVRQGRRMDKINEGGK